MRALAAGLMLIGLAACGYHPASESDASRPTYEADLSTCKDSATNQVDKQNAKTGLAWMSGPVLRWGQIGDATKACMAGKGYGQLRWCTADELKTGAHSGNVVVTSAGVQCGDPPKH